ncbi:conserved hypothetical protein [Ricinus communis]|uniref:Uncharacterized protein n=1 Tax=Ricinus communis TaxID=3988 RepID=B9SIW0_RICCO|nr:conserved hypothetical protein [Ricinus communis]
MHWNSSSYFVIMLKQCGSSTLGGTNCKMWVLLASGLGGNLGIRRHAPQDPGRTVRRALKDLENIKVANSEERNLLRYQQINSPVCIEVWETPRRGFLKCNTDVAWKSECEPAYGVILIRNPYGGVVDSHTFYFLFADRPLLGKPWCLEKQPD